jgi:hypothetical protein
MVRLPRRIVGTATTAWCVHAVCGMSIENFNMEIFYNVFVKKVKLLFLDTSSIPSAIRIIHPKSKPLAHFPPPQHHTHTLPQQAQIVKP